MSETINQPVKEKVKEYIKLFVKGEIENEELLIEMLIERVQVYLNRVDIPIMLSGILASILNDHINALAKGQEAQVSSMSDNGQSVSFDNSPITTFATKSDQELFASHTALLNNYRKVRVLKGKTNEDT